VKYRIFTLYPQIFTSFLDTSLIARAGAKGIVSFELINWKDGFGSRGYKQVDDRPYGGGSGMVIQPEPIFQALSFYNALSPFYKEPSNLGSHTNESDANNEDFSKMVDNIESPEAAITTIAAKGSVSPKNSETYQNEPNNAKFYEFKEKNPEHRKASIILTPRGYPVTQKTCEWLASEFDELTILCGRFEGFDYRIHEMVDLELSIGDFVINGGEVAAMALIEGVSRLVPEFVTKDTSVMHDSFSSSLNVYVESQEYVKLSKLERKKLEREKEKTALDKIVNKNLFDEQWWNSRLPFYEHPQYTRPANFNGKSVPEVLVNGNHKDVARWRVDWWKVDDIG
jgi:tRNA (guanine37-N1)-methyltransferase